MARAIVRFSIGGEEHGVTSNELRGPLDDAGFGRIGSSPAAYEATNQDVNALLDGLGEVLRTLKEAKGGGQPKFLSIYLDEPEPN